MAKSLMAKQMAIPMAPDEITKLRDELVKVICELKELSLQKQVTMRAYADVIGGKNVRMLEIAETLREQSSIDVSIEDILKDIDAKVAEQHSHLPEPPREDE